MKDTQHAALELLEALEALYTSFQHDGNPLTRGNRAKTDVIKHNDDVKAALNKARTAIENAKR